MRVTFLGTGAATAYPLAFCRCAHCREARRLGGRSLRARSAILVGDDLLVDLGPDVLSAAAQLGVDLSRVRYLLQTHAHSDHFDAGHLITRLAEYAGEDTPPLTVAASPATLWHMAGRLALEDESAVPWDSADTGGTIGGEGETAEAWQALAALWRARLNLSARPMAPGMRLELGSYRVGALDSGHDPKDQALVYAIEQGGRQLLYATDTPGLSEAVHRQLAEWQVQFDAVVLDQTYGPGIPGGGHLNASQAAALFERLRRTDRLKPDAQLYATHLSHEGNPPHEQADAWARDHGYRVAYDGLTLEL